jgi:hypothetical protein
MLLFEMWLCVHWAINEEGWSSLLFIRGIRGGSDPGGGVRVGVRVMHPRYEVQVLQVHKVVPFHIYHSSTVLR